MRVSSRLLLLFIVIAIVFGAFFYLFYHIKQEEMRVYAESDLHQRRNNIEAVLQMKAAAQAMLTEEYSLSDDVWDFTFRPDPAWGRRYLRNIIGVFGYSFLQVYDSEGVKVFNYSQEDLPGLADYTLSSDIIHELRAGKKLGYYQVFNQSIVYITVSSIHLVNDPQGRQPAAGFFLIAQAYNYSFLRDLAALVNYDIQYSLEDPGSGKAADRYDSNIVMPLKDNLGTSVAWISFYSSNPFLNKLRSLGNLILFGTMGFIFIFLLMQYFLIEQWISTPLGLISQSLDKMDPGIIKKLEKSDNEFAEVAALIKRFFEQQEKLVNEIDERARTEERLRDMEEESRKILITSPESIIVSDLDGMILSVNDITLSMLGFACEEDILINELRLVDLLLASERKHFKDMLKDLNSGNTVKNREFLFHKEDGGNFSAMMSASVISDNEGMPARMVFITRDLTEQKELEQQLRQSQKLESIGTLAGGIAHDFNNIITIIAGYIALASSKVEEDSSTHKDLDEALKACLRAKSLIGKILTFSRHGEPEVDDAILADIINDTIPMMRAVISSKIEIKTELNSNSYTRVDITEMQQVLINLATNAYHAMRPHSGVLAVSLNEKTGFELLGLDPKVRTDTNYLHLKVSDTGSGIKPEYINRVFDPYFSTKDTGEGSGLGLSIVHGIISGYRGFITLNSKVGEGSAFNIYLPCSARPIGKPKTERQQEYPFLPAKILMVDDEPALTEIFKQALQEASYRVETFTDAGQALEAFTADPSRYDLLIADINMPLMDGIRLAKEILIKSEIPCILYSGFLDAELQSRAQEAGVMMVLNKPILPDEMVKAVRKVMYDWSRRIL